MVCHDETFLHGYLSPSSVKYQLTLLLIDKCTVCGYSFRASYQSKEEDGGDREYYERDIRSHDDYIQVTTHFFFTRRLLENMHLQQAFAQ